MGGEIGVESVEGLGSTFSFRIPAPPSNAAVEEATQPAARQAAAVVVVDDAPRSMSARILVAEDNPTNQKVLLAYLEMAGHDIFLANNGAEAVEAAEAGAYDLVLLDIQMPVMDGLDAARAIRAQDGPTAHVPILALTASAAEGDRERFLAAGITDYLTKPVTMQALFAAIARASETYSSSSVTGDQPSPGSNVSMRAAAASVSSPRSAS
jgi:CheY-like chemotaxis protein